MRCYFSLLLATCLMILRPSLSFVVNVPPSTSFSRHRHCTTTTTTSRSAGKEPNSNSTNNDEQDDDDMNPITKASWYAVEAFGNVFGGKTKSTRRTTTTTTISLDKPPSSMDETFKRIQLDNDRQYFLSGQVDELIYDENCIFADPFVSFTGRDRFVTNLQNLGSFITKYSAKPIDYNTIVEDETTEGGNVAAVETKFMVKLQLNLPWKPVLAWPWGVRCEIDKQSNQIVLHKETWDIKPLEGVKQIFRKPTVSV